MYSQDSQDMQGRGGLARSTASFGRESRRQLTAFGGETRTIPPSGGVLRAQVHRNRTLHLGNVNVPPSRPTIEGSEDGEAEEQLLMYLQEEWNRGRGWSRAITPPRGPGTGRCARLQPDARGGPWKHDRQLWVRFGSGDNT